MINSSQDVNALELNVVYLAVWSAENYLYNKMRDLNPEEVAKSKETTNDLEKLYREVLEKYRKAKEGWERCDKILSEGTFSETIWDEAEYNTSEFFNFSNKVTHKCEDIRQEMLKNIRDSGVKP